MKRDELIEQIKRNNNEGDYVIGVVWCIEDLCSALASHKIVIEGLEWYAEEALDEEDVAACETITPEEANEILEMIERQHDAEIGINWEVIGYWVDHWVQDRREEATK